MVIVPLIIIGVLVVVLLCLRARRGAIEQQLSQIEAKSKDDLDKALIDTLNNIAETLRSPKPPTEPVEKVE